MPFSDINKCRKYHRNYIKQWRKDHPDKVKEYREKGKERKSSTTRKKYNKNKKYEHERSKKQYQKHKEKRKIYRESRKIIRRNNNLQKQFGITLDDYNRLSQQQNGVCAICKNPETTKNQYGLRPLSVDHNHKTGKVRGLLCSKCNTGLGQFQENKLFLLNAIIYLVEKDES